VVCGSSSRLGGGTSPERESFSLERNPPTWARAGRECVLNWVPSMLECLVGTCMSYCMMT